MLTEIHFRDANEKIEYTIECDIEKGIVVAWHVTLTDPLPLRTIFNIPMIMRQASTTPCSQQPVINGVRQQSVVRNPKVVRLGKDGTPILSE